MQLGAALAGTRQAWNGTEIKSELLRIALIAATYFASAKLGLALAFSTEQVTAVWPPTGVALTSLWVLGYRVAPGVFLGAFLANATAHEPASVAFAIASGNTLTAVAGVWALRSLRFDRALERSRDVLALMLVASVTPLISASLGAATLATASLITWSRYTSVWWIWWVGDSLGILMGASLLLICLPPARFSRLKPAQTLELAVFGLATLVLAVGVFAGAGNGVPFYPRAYLAFPLLVWAALRFGQREALLAAAILSACAIWGAIHGRGPFGFGPADARLALLDTFIGAIGCTALLLGAVIAELRQTQEHLRRSHDAVEGSERRLSQIIEGSPSSVAMFDQDMRYLFASRRWLHDCRLTLTQDQVRGRHHYDDFPQFPEEWKQVHARCLRGDVVRDVGSLKRADGSMAWLRWEVRPWRSEAGAIGGLLIYWDDVTAERQAQDALEQQQLEVQRSEARFRGTFDNAAVGIAHVGLDGRWLRVNDKLCSIVGYSREELLKRAFQDITHPDDLHEDLGHVERMLQGAIQTYSMEKRYLQASGQTVWANLTVSLMRQPSGEPDYFISIVEDISERKSAEHALREREREAAREKERAKFFELSGDKVCAMDHEGKLLEVNPAFLTRLRYPLSQIIGRPVMDFLHPEDRPALDRAIQETLSTGRSVEFTSRFLREDGEYRWLQWRCIADSVGRIYAVARDVTNDRQLVQALREKQASLASSLKERELLLREVHHRVKNNLQIMSSLINLQSRRLQDPSALRALLECGARIEAIALIHEKLYQVNDFAHVPFAEYVRALAPIIFIASGRSDASVRLHLDCEDIALALDKAIPCGLILNELITNALKHAFPEGAGGEVHVGLRVSSGQLLISVRDDGIGLPMNIAPAKSKSLGLQLIAILVEQVDGRLEIDRQKGTTFRIWCPLTPTQAVDGEASADPAWPSSPRHNRSTVAVGVARRPLIVGE